MLMRDVKMKFSWSVIKLIYLNIITLTLIGVSRSLSLPSLPLEKSLSRNNIDVSPSSEKISGSGDVRKDFSYHDSDMEAIYHGETGLTDEDKDRTHQKDVEYEKDSEYAGLINPFLKLPYATITNISHGLVFTIGPVSVSSSELEDIFDDEKNTPEKIPKIESLNSNEEYDFPELQALMNGQKKVNKMLVTYIGAVLEYLPYSKYNETEMGYGILKQNAETILKYAEDAKNQGADLLISPEYGMQSLRIGHSEFEEFITYTTFVPAPKNKIIPCNYESDSKNFEVMKTLSCGAIKNNMYLVINLSEMFACSNETISLAPWFVEPSSTCPDSGFLFYNTDVVFDRQGVVVARYRKQNLFMEEEKFEPGPEDDDSAMFVSDFNVLFSLQTCFDIVHDHPGRNNILRHGVKDVLMTTAWVNYLPFMLAHSIQSGWSQAMGINLLVSGYHEPQNYKMGSGIFREYTRENSIYTFDEKSGNVLIVANVTTEAFTNSENWQSTIKTQTENSTVTKQNVYQREYDQRRNSRKTLIASNLTDEVFTNSSKFQKSSKPKSVNPSTNETIEYKENSEINTKGANYVHEDFINYSMAHILPIGEYVSVEQLNITCSLEYELNSSLNYVLMVNVQQMYAPFNQYLLGVHTCAVVWCRELNASTCADIESGLPESDSFGPFKLTMTGTSIKSTFASTVHRNLSLVDRGAIQFKKHKYGYTLEAKKAVKDLLVASLIQRQYDNDLP